MDTGTKGQSIQRKLITMNAVAFGLVALFVLAYFPGKMSAAVAHCEGIHDDARDFANAVWAAAGLILAWGVGASVLVGRVVARPAQAIEDMLAASADQIARGGRLKMTGPFANAMNTMMAGQRAIVEQVGDASIQLASATAEIYAAAQEQQATAQQQSAGVEEASQTMQSLLQSAAHIAESARGVLANAERTRETTDSMSKRFSELTGHTNRIAELLEVIREIADRSDLLALNASLEATRAGDAGRSFSLVAAEMRRLAERVTASVQDVKVLVADVRAFASSTIMAIEEARRLAEGTTESARQITLVTQQQRTGTEQVSQSMRDITTALTQSVSAAGQIRTSTEELKTQADRLAEIVGKMESSAGALGGSVEQPS